MRTSNRDALVNQGSWVCYVSTAIKYSYTILNYSTTLKKTYVSSIRKVMFDVWICSINQIKFVFLVWVLFMQRPCIQCLYLAISTNHCFCLVKVRTVGYESNIHEIIVQLYTVWITNYDNLLNCNLENKYSFRLWHVYCKDS